VKRVKRPAKVPIDHGSHNFLLRVAFVIPTNSGNLEWMLAVAGNDQGADESWIEFL
jgi:hypothetical protein